MMISRVSSPALPDLRPALRLAGPARPLVGVHKRGIAGAAARDRRAPPHHGPATAGLGRPSGAGRSDPASAHKAAGAPAGHARHRPAVAPSPGQKEVDLPESHRPTAGQCRVPLQNSSYAARPAGSRSSSGGSVLLVDHAAEYFPALDRCVKRHNYRRVMVGRSLLAGLVRAVTVVVARVLAEDGSKMPFAVDQHPVGALGSCGANPHRSA
jgi:hypothetical protein